MSFTKPRRARRTLERRTPQDRHLRLARLRRRSRSCIGGAVGTEDDRRRGHRQRLLARSPTRRSPPRTSPTGADEQVLVQARRRLKVTDAAVQGRRSTTSCRRVGRTHVRDRRRVAAASGNEGQLSKDGRSALVTLHDPRRRRRRRRRASTPSLAATAAAQKAHPDLRIEQFGDAQRDKALGDSPRRRLREGRDALAADHAADPDRRLRRARRRRHPAAARRSPRSIGTLGLIGADQPDLPDGRVDQLGDPADRPRGRRRLLDVLPAARDGGARRGPLDARPRSSSPRPPPAAPCSSPASR